MARTTQTTRSLARTRNAPYQKYVRYARDAYKVYKQVRPYASAMYRGIVNRFPRATVRVQGIVPKRKTVRPVTSGGGKFRGNFKRPRRVPKKMDPFISKGFLHTSEVHGLVTDTNIVYAGHSTYSGIKVIELLAQCILRKLYKKAGWLCKSVREVIPGRSTTLLNARDRITVFVKNKKSGVTSQYSHDLTLNGTDSIFSLCGDQSATVAVAPIFPTFIAILQNYATTDYSTTTNVDVPQRIVLFREDDNGGTSTYPFTCEINLENEVVHCKSTSVLKIQNRSLAADASNQAEAVSANPLQGKLYHFSSGAPRGRTISMYNIEGMFDNTGVILARGASFPSVAQVLLEPPEAKFFWNCTKSSKIRINPGDIKQDTIKHSTVKPFLLFLKDMKFGASGLNADDKQLNLAGKSSLIALEDVINVNSDELISIAYECNKQYGMFLTSLPDSPAMGYRYDNTVDKIA